MQDACPFKETDMKKSKTVLKELSGAFLEGLLEPLKRKGELLVMICSLCCAFLGALVGYPFGEFWQITAMFLFGVFGMFVGSIYFHKKE